MVCHFLKIMSPTSVYKINLLFLRKVLKDTDKMYTLPVKNQALLSYWDSIVLLITFQSLLSDYCLTIDPILPNLQGSKNCIVMLINKAKKKVIISPCLGYNTDNVVF